MDILDLILVPIYCTVFYFFLYKIRPTFTNKNTKKYFIPAITLKFIGALMLGIVYYFYYGGGDTTQYFKFAKIILSALQENPVVGLKMLTTTGGFDPETYKYASQIEWYGSAAEYPVIKLAAFFGIFSFGSYAVVSLFYALASFSGIWALYLTFLKIFPKLHKEFAIAILFLPSVFFWGSGIMKDSITISSLGWLFYGFYTLTIEKKKPVSSLIITFCAFYLIYNIKVYILLAFLPPALLWIFNENNARIKNSLIRNIARPFFLVLGGAVAYFASVNLTAGDARYDVKNIEERTKINNDYLSKQMVSGSSYTIDTFDGSLSSILKVAPVAITVSLFRPFLWEVRSFVMLLSAFESLALLILTLQIFYKVGIFNTFRLIASEPVVLFCIIFSMILAFAVGTNSGNFGTLVRYKIPLMPFYLAGLFVMQSKIKSKSRSRNRTLIA